MDEPNWCNYRTWSEIKPVEVEGSMLITVVMGTLFLHSRTSRAQFKKQRTSRGCCMRYTSVKDQSFQLMVPRMPQDDAL
jgi:hypothetical protein